MQFATLVALIGFTAAIRIMDAPVCAEGDAACAAAAKKALAEPTAEEKAAAAKKALAEPCAADDKACLAAAAKKALAEPTAEEKAAAAAAAKK